MTTLQAALLGLVQGLTEFLPVSSSGHLFLLEKYLQINDQDLTFEIMLHLATLLAVLVFFWPQIKKLSKRQLLAIFIATLPMIPLAIVAQPLVLVVSQSSQLIGLTLLVTALINWLSHRQLQQANKNSSSQDLTGQVGTAFNIGCWQALAIFPGISRSGITLFASLKNRLSADRAFNFSFLLSIPAIIGASVFSFVQSPAAVNSLLSFDQYQSLLLAMTLAFAGGYLSLKLLKNVLHKRRLLFFSLYCLVLGLSQLLLT